MQPDDFGAQRRMPRTAVVWLILINVVILLVASIIDGGRPGEPLKDTLAFSFSDVRSWRVVAVVTAAFMHDNLYHLLMNMFGLFIFGREVERLIGPKQFVWLYLAGGLLGNIVFVGFYFASPGIAVLGASGALFGVMIATVMLLPNLEVSPLFLPVSLKMKHVVIIYMAIEIMMALGRVNSGVAHLAHLGGALGGFLFIKFAVPTGPRASGWKVISNRVNSTQSGSRIPAAPKRPSTPTVTSDVPVARSRPARRAEASLTPEEIEAQMDAVLDKLSEKGPASLTRREREILERASDNFKKESS